MQTASPGGSLGGRSNLSINQYLRSLDILFKKGSDDEIISFLKQQPATLKESVMLFHNSEAAVGSFEANILRSHRLGFWRRAVALGHPLLINPRQFIAPRHLRIKTLTTNDSDRAGRDRPHRGGGAQNPAPEELLTADPMILRRHGCLTVAEYCCRLTRSSVLETMLPILERDHAVEVLHTACSVGSRQMVMAVLDGPVPVTVHDTFRDLLPLHVSIESGREACLKVSLLLRRGADANAVARQDVNIPPLLLAAGRGDPELVSLLLKHGADPNATAPVSPRSTDICLTAAARWSPDLFKRSPLKLRSNLVCIIPSFQSLGLPTALSHAIYWGFEDVVKCLCENSHIDYSIKSASGETVFQTAANAVAFARLKKPSHIQRLPLPKTPVAICERILTMLHRYAEEAGFTPGADEPGLEPQDAPSENGTTTTADQSPLKEVNKHNRERGSWTRTSIAPRFVKGDTAVGNEDGEDSTGSKESKQPGSIQHLGVGGTPEFKAADYYSQEEESTGPNPAENLCSPNGHLGERSASNQLLENIHGPSNCIRGPSNCSHGPSNCSRGPNICFRGQPPGVVAAHCLPEDAYAEAKALISFGRFSSRQVMASNYENPVVEAPLHRAYAGEALFCGEIPDEVTSNYENETTGPLPDSTSGPFLDSSQTLSIGPPTLDLMLYRVSASPRMEALSNAAAETPPNDDPAERMLDGEQDIYSHKAGTLLSNQ